MSTLIVTVAVRPALLQFNTPSAAAAPPPDALLFANRCVFVFTKKLRADKTTKFRNVNGGIVPATVNLHLFCGNSGDHQRTSRRPHSSLSSPRSPPRQRSASPEAGDKRARSPSDDDLRSTQSQRIAGSSGRPRAKDLDELTKEYVVCANDRYRVYISVEQGFPENPIETVLVRRVWDETCEEMGERLPLTPTIAKLVRST